jgi:phosphoribosylamine--glycine ligase
MLSGAMLGEAGRLVVLEEFLEGEELSFLVLCDGERVAPLVAARDHKRVGDGDTGPNTGGMGAYSAPGLIDDAMRDWLLQHIARPVVAGMKAEGAEYRGILYCGLMLTVRGPMVLEFNCRFGDPETQPIVMRLDSDIVEAFEAAVEGRVSDGDFKWSNDAAVCVVLASAGYPGTPELGKKISGLERAAALGAEVFHAGTARREDGFYTSGGRVLGVTARGADLSAAIQRAYAAAAEIHFDGMHFRRDIAAKAVGRS